MRSTVRIADSAADNTVNDLADDAGIAADDAELRPCTLVPLPMLASFVIHGLT